MSEPITLTLYYRSGCSLCEEMQAEIVVAQSRYSFQLDTLDIDSDESLVLKYGHKVPVLTSERDGEICHYFLDHSALAECFSEG